MKPLIEIRKLAKRFGRLEVLKVLDIDIGRGQATAVVGHNGSGKTTLIKTILGLVRPDSGHISFDGERLNGGSLYRARIGYMPQSARFPDNLTASNLLSMVEDVRGRTGTRTDELVRIFSLASELEKPLRTLSGGTRQKVSVVMAFMFEPDVLILDEPTAGLDPVSSSVLKDLIAGETHKGRTVILTSHVMSEIEELSDDVVFLQDGRVRFQGKVEAVTRGTGEANLERAIARMMMEKAA